MKNVLYLDACVREESRTRKLVERFLSSIKCDEGFTVSRVDLPALDIYPLNRTRLEKKNLDEAAGDFADPRYDLAKQFAKADAIVIAAPYWDSSFPAKLKVYIENITIGSLTFRYDEKGQPEKLINADRVVYISTAGGFINKENSLKLYLKELFGMFAVSDVRFYCAEGLDFMTDKIDELLNREYDKIMEDGSNLI